VTLGEAAARADEFAEAGDERALADLRREWEDELEDAIRSADYRQRAIAYRAIGQFRFRQKIELIKRGLDDESPACRGSALISLERLSRDGPAPVNSSRSLLHRLLANPEENAAVRRLAVICLKNGSPQRDTIVLLEGLGEDDRQDRELREAATKIAAVLKKKSR
jgi:HEAT repeat protein